MLSDWLRENKHTCRSWHVPLAHQQSWVFLEGSMKKGGNGVRLTGARRQPDVCHHDNRQCAGSVCVCVCVCGVNFLDFASLRFGIPTQQVQIQKGGGTSSTPLSGIQSQNNAHRPLTHTHSYTHTHTHTHTHTPHAWHCSPHYDGDKTRDIYWITKFKIPRPGLRGWGGYAPAETKF